jgi:hypothetical protein
MHPSIANCTSGGGPGILQKVRQVVTKLNNDPVLYRLFLGSFKGLGFRRCAEYLNQAVGDQFFLSVFQLPDRKTEVVRIARRAVVVGVTVRRRPIRIPPAQAAGSGAHASNSQWPSVG